MLQSEKEVNLEKALMFMDKDVSFRDLFLSASSPEPRALTFSLSRTISHLGAHRHILKMTTVLRKRLGCIFRECIIIIL